MNRHSICDSDRDQLVSGYCIGAIGAVTELHGRVYHDRCGFDKTFEAFVAHELAEFVEKFNSDYDGIWLYKRENQIIGCIAIDGSLRDTEGARLRFLIVDPNCHGRGIGRVLMKTAMDFCLSRSMSRIYLWTTPALEEAKRLYERFGFQQSEEVPSNCWGVAHINQRFEQTVTKSGVLDLECHKLQIV